MPQPMGSIRQMAYVVRDAEEAAQNWSRVLGVGPFFIGTFSTPIAVHEGQVVNRQSRIAHSYSGAMMIELIEPLGEEPSHLSELLGKGGGLHHVAWRVPDFDATLKKLNDEGCPTVMSAQLSADVRAAYVDARAKFGTFIELSTLTPDLNRFFDNMERLCRDWDGVDPIRPYAGLPL